MDIVSSCVVSFFCFTFLNVFWSVVVEMARDQRGGDTYVVRPLRNAPDGLEAAVMMINLERMLQCIDLVERERLSLGKRGTELVPGSAVFHPRGAAELAFFADSAQLQEGDGDPDGGGQSEDESERQYRAWEMPNMVQPFVVSLVYAALWLEASQRNGEEVVHSVVSVLSPEAIYEMLRSEMYMHWNVQDALDFVATVPFVPLVSGAWYYSNLVSQWREYVRVFRCHQFLAGLVRTGVIESWDLITELDNPSLLSAETVTYDCLSKQGRKRDGRNRRDWPEVVMEDEV